jgi:hypothetical protein
MAARARLYERVVHDRGPWAAVVNSRPCQTHSIPLTRHACGDRVVLSGYLNAPVSGVTAVDIWCRGEMLVSWPVSPQQEPTPVRICLELNAEDAELAA